MSVKVKICGITNLPDALAAVDAGADALGFMFFNQSPRNVTIETAAEISRQLPPHILRTGVFVNPPEELVFRAIAECGLNFLQFHGEETPEFCTQFGVMSMKAFRIRDADSLNALAQYNTDAWLLDACSNKGLGGTGEKFDWNLAAEASTRGRLIFLAGGLTPENVEEAVKRVQPFGVDVSSGVESAPGRKDAQKVQAFIRAAKNGGQIQS
jgi:phosphoribosylanthranilate isomerase